MSWFVALLFWVAQPAYESRFFELPVTRAQTPVSGWLGSGWPRVADRFWAWTAKSSLEQARDQWKRLRAELSSEAAGLPKAPAPPELDDDAASESGTYGKLPDVRVDLGTGAVFPVPIAPPARFSHYQLAERGRKLLRTLQHVELSLAQWKQLPISGKVEAYPQISDMFAAVHEEFVRAASEARYLETWLPRLNQTPERRSENRARPNSERLVSERLVSERLVSERLVSERLVSERLVSERLVSERLVSERLVSERLVDALRESDPDTLRELRESFRPRRVLKRMFLPADLGRFRGANLTIPIATDIDSAAFRREFEGAVDMHWNRSPWAKSQGIRFTLRWISVARDGEFAKVGPTGLAAHLERFPAGPAILTTGGLSTSVRGRALVLGPSPVSARTLAHEFGHLLGFEDCYFRTLSSQGAFGLAVLEWANPYFPDELMCDDTIGVARAVRW